MLVHLTDKLLSVCDGGGPPLGRHCARLAPCSCGALARPLRCAPAGRHAGNGLEDGSAVARVRVAHRGAWRPAAGLAHRRRPTMRRLPLGGAARGAPSKVTLQGLQWGPLVQARIRPTPMRHELAWYRLRVWLSLSHGGCVAGRPLFWCAANSQTEKATTTRHNRHGLRPGCTTFPVLLALNAKQKQRQCLGGSEAGGAQRGPPRCATSAEPMLAQIQGLRPRLRQR